MKALKRATLFLVLVFLVLASVITLFWTVGSMFVADTVIVLVLFAAVVAAVAGLFRRARIYWFTTLLLGLYFFYFAYLYLQLERIMILGFLLVNIIGFVLSLRLLMASRRKQKAPEEKVSQEPPVQVFYDRYDDTPEKKVPI